MANLNPSNGQSLADYIDSLYRTEGRIVLATLIRLLGDFDLAEEAMHDACLAALQQWQQQGIPDRPRAWLISTGRFKAIDVLRRRGRLDQSMRDIYREMEHRISADSAGNDPEVPDDQLRLVFTCCHPILPRDAQIALTLREVMGLTTEEIARAYLCPAPTIAQRIVRAKHKLKSAGVPFVVPEAEELPARLNTVLNVIYLVFNEGYSASSGADLIRADLCTEAIRLVRVLLKLLPDPEVSGLLALMLLHQARYHGRSSPEGEIILLEDQDRTLWNKALIAEGATLVGQALASRRFGPYTVQAAIAAIHAEAEHPAATNWREIVSLYDVLMTMTPSPVVELNRAVAIAMSDGPEAGLQLVDALIAAGQLADYHLIHAARADLCRRLGLMDAAIASYERALELTQQAPEQRFLRRRIAECRGY